MRRRPTLDEHLWTIAVARLIFEPAMNIQAPPNLSPGALRQLIAAGINDWGGVSPVTPDHVNPEAPWPHLDVLERATDAAGKTLVERLAIYPAYRARAGALARSGAAHARCSIASTATALPRTDDWSSGHVGQLPPRDVARRRVANASRPARARGDLAKAQRGATLDEGEIVAPVPRARRRFRRGLRAPPTRCARDVNGDAVSYVVNRNINYTNICSFSCQFCAFSKGKMQREPARQALRSAARRNRSAASREAWAARRDRSLHAGRHPSRLHRRRPISISAAR